MAMLSHCPLLLPQDRHGRVYDGFISCQDKDFRLRVILPEDLQLQNAKIECSWQLKKALQGYQDVVKQGNPVQPKNSSMDYFQKDEPTTRKLCATKELIEGLLPENCAHVNKPGTPRKLERLQHSPDLVSFMMELKTVMDVALKNTALLEASPAPQYYSCLVKDIENLGWEKLLFVDNEFSTLMLKAEDSSAREHTITVKLGARYPYKAPDCCVDLPVPFTVSWTPQSTLQDIYNQVLSALESLKDFWDALDEIDKKTWVLEPEKPSRSATIRRIAIGNNVSITIDVDPRHPTMLPECYFLGADHVVQPLKEKLNNNIDLWPSEEFRDEWVNLSRRVWSARTKELCLGSGDNGNLTVPWPLYSLDLNGTTLPPQLSCIRIRMVRNPDAGLLQNLKDVLEIDFPSRSDLEKTRNPVQPKNSSMDYFQKDEPTTTSSVGFESLTWKLCATKELIEGLLPENCAHVNKPGTPRKLEDFSMDCGICYAYRLESSIPDQVCDDPHCGQPFHQACLYELWLLWDRPTSSSSSISKLFAFPME